MLAMRSLLCVAFVLAAIGCSTVPLEIQSMNYEPQADQQYAAAQLPVGCRVHVASVQDMRNNTTDLGDLGRPLHAVFDLQKWISDGLNSLNNLPPAAPTSVDALQTTTVDLYAGLRNAYMRGIATSKCTNVVLTIKYQLNDRPLAEKNYRGLVTCLNWISSENEIKDSFNEALAQIVHSVARDVSGYCTTVVNRDVAQTESSAEGAMTKD